MLKLIGAVLVIAGAAGLGLSYRQDLQDRLYHARRLHTILELLESEISYSKASLPEACRMVSGRMDEPYRAGLYKVWEIMSSNQGLAFSFVWKQEMGKCIRDISIGILEKEEFLNFANSNGYADNRMQIKTLEKCRENLGQSIKKQEERMESKSKVVMSMGLIGGIFLAIVLL